MYVSTKTKRFGVFMLKLAVLIMMATSCVKQPIPSLTVPHMYDLSTLVGPDYSTTNSPCLDGLLVNLGYACKTMVGIEGRGVITYVHCYEAKAKDSAWDDYIFIVIGDLSIGAPPNTQSLCTDRASAIYFSERS